MDREAFLARIAESSGSAERRPAPRPYSPPEPAPLADRIDRLIREHEAVGGIAHRVGSPAAAGERIVEILTEEGARTVVRGEAPAVFGRELDAALDGAGISVTVAHLASGSSRELLRSRAFEADAGVTAVDLAVAETGTLALLAAPGQGRAVSLLPPIHVAVLQARDVVEELSALFDAATSRGALPSALTFITGPSRTGDIEQQLTIGVHGPGKLHLVLIE